MKDFCFWQYGRVGAQTHVPTENSKKRVRYITDFYNINKILDEGI
jgi:hypothetical protein